MREQTGLPVSCSFELSSALGGPRRALTTLLNARLISLLDRLVRATEAQMAHLGLDCPLMVVKGDGSLLHIDYARTRPVETILSGPAASLAGAAFLANKKQALVADIGGTIVQGRYDMICPPHMAEKLHRVWPKSELLMIAKAGHALSEPGITFELVRAMDRLARDLG